MTRFIPNLKIFFWSLQAVVFFRRFCKPAQPVFTFHSLCARTQRELLQNAATSLNSKNTGSKGVLGNAFSFSFLSQGWALQLCSHTSFLAGSILPVLAFQRGAGWEDDAGGMKVTLPWIPDLSSAFRGV